MSGYFDFADLDHEFDPPLSPPVFEQQPPDDTIHVAPEIDEPNATTAPEPSLI